MMPLLKVYLYIVLLERHGDDYIRQTQSAATVKLN